ncbi:Coenzyme F420 hydrogenase/dehydrogenase, beta subunit C-terminal domain [Streptomyces tauricus]|uniref:Coenzyme F420 hydrogenase/dehydrogenase, beta subunit C-terminal domain n=1 Tax=Streptomyces tauricus TaxID=68274 RepID=A0ABZ1JAS1_9ACTN|nr:Coenzyme F420 hydrogenase/dehydrogenase, beta subunit C-terminal domain [Streptomyces tauricus]
MTFQQLSEAVLQNDLCTVCGACQLACPAGVVGFSGLEPVLTEPSWTESDCGDCRDCLDVCPGADPGTPAAETRLFGRSRTPGERWTGIFSEVLAGHALDPVVFEASASGGSLTALLQTALAVLGTDVVLTMGRDPEQPWRAAPALIREPGMLAETAQSTYQLAPYLGALRDVMLTEPDADVAVVGVACHIQALRKLQAMDTAAGRWARDHVVLAVEPACSSSTRPEGTRAVIEERALVPVDSVVRLRYREGDYPGEIAIGTRDGGDHRVAFWQAVRDFAKNKTYRCLACGDWLSGLADVSVSDGDPNIFAASVEGARELKHGRVFVRTEAGAAAVAAARDHGFFTGSPTDLSGLNLGLERKRNRRASYERSGRPVPHGPIPGHREELDIVPDERWLAVPGQDGATDGTSDRSADRASDRTRDRASDRSAEHRTGRQPDRPTKRPADRPSERLTAAERGSDR